MLITRRHALIGSAALVGCRTEAPGAEPAKREGSSIIVPGSGSTSGSNLVRPVQAIVDAMPTKDGAGVRLSRALGNRALPMLDPFLMLDQFKSDDPNDYAAGFPEHPHRGFETVTYMIDGAMEHKDSVGNSGRLVGGSAQWMTAGHGIVHSEMPKQERGLMWGFQLWVNLPRARKLIKPRYQDIPPGQIPGLDRDGSHIRVVAGTAFGTTGPITGIDVEPLFLDVALIKGARFEVPIPANHNSFAFVTDGAVRLGPDNKEVRAGQLAVFGPGDRVLSTCDASGGRMVLLAGRPINEPVARGGPFVMNTQDEIRQAWDDYRSGKLVTPSG